MCFRLPDMLCINVWVSSSEVATSSLPSDWDMRFHPCLRASIPQSTSVSQHPYESVWGASVAWINIVSRRIEMCELNQCVSESWVSCEVSTYWCIIHATKLHLPRHYWAARGVEFRGDVFWVSLLLFTYSPPSSVCVTCQFERIHPNGPRAPFYSLSSSMSSAL